jgi:hypothetical protein
MFELPLCGELSAPQPFDLHQEHTDPVPTRAVLVNHPSIPSPIVRKYLKSGAVTRVPTKPFRLEEQLLEPLALLERRLRPQVGGARQNAFCVRQDAPSPSGSSS